MYKNRILISLGLVAGLTFLGVRSFATSTGVVNTETARMRAEASTTSNIVALVSQDEKVEMPSSTEVEIGEKEEQTHEFGFVSYVLLGVIVAVVSLVFLYLII